MKPNKLDPRTVALSFAGIGALLFVLACYMGDCNAIHNIFPGVTFKLFVLLLPLVNAGILTSTILALEMASFVKVVALFLIGGWMLATIYNRMAKK